MLDITGDRPEVRPWEGLQITLEAAGAHPNPYMDVDVWIFDPPVLTEPWYAKQVYKKLTNEDGSLRIRYWDFSENQNNDVIVNDSGTSDFSDLTFTDSDDN